MPYSLRFKQAALEEWHKLDGTLKVHLKKKLAERLENPRVAAAKMYGHRDRFKIKLRQAGYRLVYEVRDTELVVMVVAIGKRERNAVYKAAARR